MAGRCTSTNGPNIPRKLFPKVAYSSLLKGRGLEKYFQGLPRPSVVTSMHIPSREVDADFVQHAIQHRIAMLIGEARGDIPGLSKDHLAEHKMALPPTAEQRRIVTKLDTLTARLARA